MMAQYFVFPFGRAVSASNVLLPGAKLYFYVSATTTPAAVYTSKDLNVAHTNPVIADSGGLFPAVYLDPLISYRAVLKTSNENLVAEVDPYTPTKDNSSVSPKDYGAVGNGITDDKAKLLVALNAAASLGKFVDGGGATYAVDGTFEMPATARLRNLTIKQINTASSDFRPIYQSGGGVCHLEKIKVDRGTNGNAGSLTDSAGIWIDNCANVRLIDCEVTGFGKGNGICVADCAKVLIDKPYVHDMLAGSATHAVMTDDVLQGIFLARCDQATITAPRVENLRAQWTGQAATNRFTRGLAFSDNKDWTLVAAYVDNVDQGIDVTGGNNSRFSIIGGSARNCGIFGWKFANSTTRGSVHGATAYRCGISGFVCSVPGAGAPIQTNNLDFFGCIAVETGYGGAHGIGGTIAGFRCMSSANWPTHPRGIRFHGCQAHGDGAPMQYGFFSDAVAAAPVNECIKCEVTGATVAAFIGLGKSKVRAVYSAPSSTPHGTTMVFNSETVDELGEYDPGTGVFTAKIRGKVFVRAQWRSEGVPAGAPIGVSLHVGGAPQDRYQLVNQSAAVADMIVSTQSVVAVVPGTEIRAIAYTNGGTYTINPNPELTYLQFDQVD